MDNVIDLDSYREERRLAVEEAKQRHPMNHRRKETEDEYEQQ